MLTTLLTDHIQELLLTGLFRAFVIFISQLGVVYIFGRMLEICNSDRMRNGIAIVTGFPVSYWLVHMYDLNKLVHPLEIYWRTFIYGAAACILFVLIGWKLFDRVDHLLDAKFAKDNDTQRKRKSKK